MQIFSSLILLIIVNLRRLTQFINLFREDFQTRIIKIQQNLEDGKEVLRNTLYQESLRSKNSKSALVIKPGSTDQTIKVKF